MSEKCTCEHPVRDCIEAENCVGVQRFSKPWNELATLAQRLAEAERILRDTLDAIPGEAIGKKQIVAFLENVHDNVQLWEDER